MTFSTMGTLSSSLPLTGKFVDRNGLKRSLVRLTGTEKEKCALHVVSFSRTAPPNQKFTIIPNLRELSGIMTMLWESSG